MKPIQTSKFETYLLDEEQVPLSNEEGEKVTNVTLIENNDRQYPPGFFTSL